MARSHASGLWFCTGKQQQSACRTAMKRLSDVHDWDGTDVPRPIVIRSEAIEAAAPRATATTTATVRQPLAQLSNFGVSRPQKRKAPSELELADARQLDSSERGEKRRLEEAARRVRPDWVAAMEREMALSSWRYQHGCSAHRGDPCHDDRDLPEGEESVCRECVALMTLHEQTILRIQAPLRATAERVGVQVLNVQPTACDFEFSSRWEVRNWLSSMSLIAWPDLPEPESIPSHGTVRGAAIPKTMRVTGLSPNTLYHVHLTFRANIAPIGDNVVGHNDYGTIELDALSFRTPERLS